MQFLRVFLLGLCVLGAPLSAKPLLTNSQDSYAKACLAFDETYERVLRICELALAGEGFSKKQKLEMMASQGNAYLGLDQFDAARTVYERMLRLDPTDTEALNGLGWVMRNQDDYDGAAASFEASLAHHPSAESLAGMAASRFAAGQIDLAEALSQLDASLAIDPDYRWALREKGWMLRDAERLDEAAASFQAALVIEPEDVNALSGLARSLRGQNKFDAALKQVGLAIKLEPDNADLLAERSLILFYLDRNKQAIKDADRVIALDPNWSGGYVRKARALSDLGRNLDAVAVLAAAEEQTGFDPYLVYWQADILAEDNEFDASLVQLSRLVEAGVEDVHDLHLLTFVQLGRNDIVGAREAVDAALARDPEGAFSLYYDARVLVEEGKLDRAEKRMTAAVDAGLSDHNIGLFLGALATKGAYVQMIRLRIAFNG